MEMTGTGAGGKPSVGWAKWKLVFVKFIIYINFVIYKWSGGETFPLRGTAGRKEKQHV
jgi:hypothetical protein